MKFTGPFYLLLILFLLLGSSPQIVAAPYQTGEALTRSIGTELWNSLPKESKRQFPSNIVVIAEDARPWAQPTEIRDSMVAGRYVAVSRGFIDLMNNISHAKAIDYFEPGFFQRYVRQLSRESGRFPLQQIPEAFEEKHWKTEIVNLQQSNFNQMVAMVIAMQLAHHELGHFKKFKTALDPASAETPLNHLLSAREWDDALRLAVKNSLNAGYGVEGFEALCEAIQRMPQHPQWTAYFLPRRVNMSRVERELHNSERHFFNNYGREF